MIRRILARVVTFTMLAVAIFLILMAAFGEGQRATLLGSLGGCVFWLAIIFDRRPGTPKVVAPPKREEDGSAAPAPSLTAS
jgi:hypothetical protein